MVGQHEKVLKFGSVRTKLAITFTDKITSTFSKKSISQTVAVRKKSVLGKNKQGIRSVCLSVSHTNTCARTHTHTHTHITKDRMTYNWIIKKLFPNNYPKIWPEAIVINEVHHQAEKLYINIFSLFSNT